MSPGARVEAVSPVNTGADRYLDEIHARSITHRTDMPGGKLVLHAWGDPDAAPLVLLHGGFGSWRHWVHNVVPLSHHYHVLAVDLPGLGESDILDGEYTADSIASAVWQGLRQVLGDAARPFVAGFSFGGIIGAHVAALAAGQVGAFVAVAPGALGITMNIPPLESLSGKRQLHNVRAVHRINLERLMLADPRRIDELALHVQVETVKRARARSGRIPHGDATTRALERCRCPIAGLWGERDVIGEQFMEARRRLFRRIQPGCPFHVIQGAGHWVMYERPERFNPVLLNLLNRFQDDSGEGASP